MAKSLVHRGSAEKRGWLLLDKRKPLVWRKEVLPVGHWEKLDENGDGQSFEVTPKLLSHLVKSVKQLRSNGVTIPYAKAHDGWELAENRYGEIIGASIGKNARGGQSFFVDVKFDNERAAKVCTKSDSSVGIPEKFFDGKGNEYSHPLRHVAATNAPVIPGLGRWRSIAASFDFKSLELDRDGVRGKGDGPGGGGGGSASDKALTKARDDFRKAKSFLDGALKGVENGDADQRDVSDARRDLKKANERLKLTSKIHKLNQLQRSFHKSGASGKMKASVDRDIAKAQKKLKSLKLSAEPLDGEDDIELGDGAMWEEIAKMLGIDVEGMDEAEAMSAIKAAISELKGGSEDEAEMSEEDDDSFDFEDFEDDEDEDAEMSDEPADDEELGIHKPGKPSKGPRSITKTRTEKIQMSSSPLVIGVVRDNRREQIKSLLHRRKIDSATARKLEASFCGKKRISLELSQKASNSEFSRAVKLLSSNDPLKLRGRSATVDDLSQEMELEASYGKDSTADVLVKDAERRAEAAKSA